MIYEVQIFTNLSVSKKLKIQVDKDHKLKKYNFIIFIFRGLVYYFLILTQMYIYVSSCHNM